MSGGRSVYRWGEKIFTILEQKKFGELDQELKSLIETAPIEKIEEVAVNIFVVESINEIKEMLRESLK